MSERSDAFGAKAPKHTIEHKGKVYQVSSVLTEGMMTEIESRLYARARKALTEARDDYPLDIYVAKLDELRKKFEDGDYAFENQAEMLKDPTSKAAKRLGFEIACVLLKAPEHEVLELLARRGPELQSLIKQAQEASFPAAAVGDPKAQAPALAG